MIRMNRLFTSLMLAFALLAQPLATLAQNKALNSSGPNSSALQTASEVNIAKLRLSGNDIAEVNWEVALPAGVEVQGFDVRVDATLSNGTAQTDSKSFGGNARFGSFKFNLPLASNGGAKPGGNGGNGTIGTISPASIAEKEIASKGAKSSSGAKTVEVKETKSGEKTARKFGEGNISGGNNNGGNNTGGNSGGLKPNPNPNPTPLPRPTPPTQKPEAARITSLRAFITAKFAAGNDLAAFREFIQPTDKTTGEMTIKGGRGTSLQVRKLIHLNEVARLATECPAGQECFDILAEIRGVDANGQFKVSAEVIFANGVRRNTSRTTGNLLRPVRISVDKIAGTQVANVLVNINGGGNREQFVKTDTQGLGILQSVGAVKK